MTRGTIAKGLGKFTQTYVGTKRNSPPLGRNRKTCVRASHQRAETRSHTRTEQYAYVCVCVVKAWQRSQQQYQIEHIRKSYKITKKNQQQQIPQTANVYTMYDKQ